MPKHAKTEHDPLCTCFTGSCCPWIANCECQCMCDFILEIRQDERKKLGVCHNCGNRCWEPLDMSEDVRRVYNAIFNKEKGPLHWAEDEDCGMRDLMYSIASAAVDAIRKRDREWTI